MFMPCSEIVLIWHPQMAWLKMSPNVGFTRSFGGALCQLFNTDKAHLAAKICPKCLPEPANAGPLAGGRRASLARRAEHPRSYGTAGSAARKSCCTPYRADEWVGDLAHTENRRSHDGVGVLLTFSWKWIPIGKLLYKSSNVLFGGDIISLRK